MQCESAHALKEDATDKLTALSASPSSCRDKPRLQAPFGVLKRRGVFLRCGLGAAASEEAFPEPPEVCFSRGG